MSLLPPGRFLMPGNLAGSPALTFAPLELPADGAAPEGSLWAMMVRRYEAYKDVVVRPFFRDHFSRLDRQIVLVDALAAFNAGPEALHDLEAALAGILGLLPDRAQHACSASLFRPRIDRILFAATKADHLHHSSHDRLEAVLRRTRGQGRRARRICRRRRSTSSRWRRCAPPARRRSRAAATSCPSIIGTPPPGEIANGETLRRQYRGRDLSGRPARRSGGAVQGRSAFRGLSSAPAEKTDFRFLRFRPPLLEREGGERARSASHPP